jgi:hypothetical protein
MVSGEPQLTVLGPPYWPTPRLGGLRQEASGKAGSGPIQWGGHPTTRKVSSILRKVSSILRKVSSILKEG